MIYKRRVLKIICENCDTPPENELRFSKIDDNIKNDFGQSSAEKQECQVNWR